jgi:CRP-like cAMP-binding protein
LTVSPHVSRWAPGSFLDRLSDEQCAELLARGVRRQFEGGRRLLREGDASTHVELLLQGFMKITNLVEGTEALRAIRMPGDLVGELAALTGRPRIATATTCGRVTSSVISQADFHRFLQQHPEAALSLASSMGDRLRWANGWRGDLAAFPPEVRLARLLVEIVQSCARRTEEGLTIAIPLSQPELATMIGVSDATAQKAFRYLRENAVIRTGYRRITVLDLPALRALAEGPDDWRTLTG